ncbi:sulfate transporter CysZ [Allohahella marinimesophila]|uniref:Sulfate transporter CysZ n=1 Tax=Allohahella marinimesophila TaxID=1054972 RepID=A0ABP7PUU2_9GAMM
MNSSFSRGAGYISSGFKIIRRPGLRLYVWLPIFLNLIVFSVLTYAAVTYTDLCFAWLMGFMPEWLLFLEWLLWLVFGVLLLLVYSQTFVLLATLVGAPFYAILAERVEQQERAARGGPVEKSITQPNTVAQLVKVLPLALARETRKLMYYLPRALLLLIVSFIPGINTVAPLLWLAFSMWMLAVEMVDYAVDQNGLPFIRVLTVLKRARMTSYGFGGTALAATYVPILNLFILPAAVAGGVLFWLDSQGVTDTTPATPASAPPERLRAP